MKVPSTAANNVASLFAHAQTQFDLKISEDHTECSLSLIASAQPSL